MVAAACQTISGCHGVTALQTKNRKPPRYYEAAFNIYENKTFISVN